MNRTEQVRGFDGVNDRLAQSPRSRSYSSRRRPLNHHPRPLIRRACHLRARPDGLAGWGANEMGDTHMVEERLYQTPTVPL